MQFKRKKADVGEVPERMTLARRLLPSLCHDVASSERLILYSLDSLVPSSCIAVTFLTISMAALGLENSFPLDRVSQLRGAT